MNGLLHAHSGLRWIVLVLLVAAVVNAWAKKGKGTFTPGDKKLGLFAMIAFHTQFLIGWVLYFVNGWYKFEEGTMQIAAQRFFAIEHAFGMVLAFVLITIGHKKMKTKPEAEKLKAVAVFYTLALIALLISIPWPFLEKFAGRGWF